MLILIPIFIFCMSFQAFGQETSTCINMDANPKNTFFIDQLKNPPKGSFLSLWKKSRSQISHAAVCVGCEKIEPSIGTQKLENISVDTQPNLEESEIEDRLLPDPIKIEKSYFGRYFYKNKNGKKIRISAAEAIEIIVYQAQRDLASTINEKVAQSFNINLELEIKKLQQEQSEHQNRLEGPPPKELNMRLDPKCVERTLHRFKTQGTRRACREDQGNGRVMTSNPCINKDVANYITWSMNKAFECMNDPKNPISKNLFFKKLNLESNFNFWIENNNSGSGIGQMTATGIKEVMGSSYDRNLKRTIKHDGRKMLERIMTSNPKCKMFEKVINPHLPARESIYPNPYKANKCAQLSMDEGLQRGLIASMALYRFYRDEQKIYSSENSMKALKIPRTNPDYNDIKNLLALMSYSRIGSQKARVIALSLQGKIKPDITVEKFKELVKKHKAAQYLRDLDDKFEIIKNPGEELICVGSY